jgi:hypothetical protein
MLLPHKYQFKLQQYVDSNIIEEELLYELMPYYYSYKRMKSISSTENMEAFRLLKIIFEDKYPEYII